MPADRRRRAGARRRAAYGEWRSPITTAVVAEGGVRLAQPRTDGEHVYWLETRPTEHGRTALMRSVRGGAPSEISPARLSVRSRAHEYGGGAYGFAGPYVWFVADDDQCIYELAGLGRCRRVTAPAARRYADLQPDLGRGRLICIEEDHEAAREPANRLVAIDLAGGARRSLVDDLDFVASPALSPDGRRLAWLGWRHPNLPWDETELWVAEFDDTGALRSPRRLLTEAPGSVFQPRWGIDGTLYFVSDHSDWWNLYRWRSGSIESLAPLQAEFGMPQWNFGMSTYGFIDADTLLCAWTCDGLWKIGRLNLASGGLQPIRCDYDAIEHLDASGGLGVMLAGSASSAPAIVTIDTRARLTILHRSCAAELDPGYVAEPQSIEFATDDGDRAHALYYPPANRDHVAPRASRPPLLVKCHGGPTSATSTMQNPRIQFWTSRGFAVLDVNYRGSTGFGRSYRRKLYGQWGIADVADCVAGARYACRQGWADAERAVITGGSAGGYVVLCALAFHDFFAAGASYFGIADLQSMFAETHKFESHYDHWLIGPRERIATLAAARSPALHAERIDRPVILLQGLDDKVVPPSQSEKLAEVLRRRGVPVCYLAFAGEAHGFRRADTISRAIEAEFGFYARTLGFSPADPLTLLQIENLPP